MKFKPNRCPFCSCDDISFSGRIDSNKKYMTYWMQCDFCIAKGPALFVRDESESRTKDEYRDMAIELWNGILNGGKND